MTGQDPADITSPSGEPIDWDARLQAAIDQTTRRKANRRREREAFSRRRKYGLEQRHAAKLNRGPRGTSDHVSNESPTPTKPQVTEPYRMVKPVRREAVDD